MKRLLCVAMLVLGSMTTACTKQTPEERFLADLKAKAAQGDADGQYRLGCASYFGEGVAQDKAEGVRRLRLAAAQDYW